MCFMCLNVLNVLHVLHVLRVLHGRIVGLLGLVLKQLLTPLSSPNVAPCPMMAAEASGSTLNGDNDDDSMTMRLKN